MAKAKNLVWFRKLEHHDMLFYIQACVALTSRPPKTQIFAEFLASNREPQKASLHM